MAKYMPVGGRISANRVINKAVSAVPKNIGPTIANQQELNKTVEYKSPLAEWSKSLKASKKIDTSPRNYGRTNTNRWHFGLYDDEKTPGMTLGDYTYKPLLSGYYNQRMNEAIGKNRLDGNLDFDTPEIVKYQSLYEKFQPIQFDNPKAPGGLLNKGIQGAMGLTGQRIADLTDEDTVTYAGVGAAAGAMAGSVAPLAGNVIGAGTGFSAGIATGVGKNMFESVFGSTYKGLVDAGVSDNTAYKTALISAGMQSALEMAQVDELVKATKLLKKQGKTVLAEGIEKMLLDRGKSIFTNSAEEVFQESVAMAGEYYAKSKENLPTDSWEDNVRRAGQTALESAISFGIFSLPGTISTGAQIYNHNNHMNKQNNISDVVSEDSKINAKEFVSEFKSPQEFQGWAEKFADRANVDIEFVADENDSFNGYFSSYNESKNGRAGKIVVNINAKDPINTVFAHELTHALEINEAEYNDYANFAINNILSEHYGTNDITHLAELKASFYSQKGVNIDMDSAKKEIVAELTSEYVLKDEKAIESLFRYNESLFYRIFENIKSMIKRFTGTKEERNLIRARDLYAKVLKANGKSHVITSDDIQTEATEATEAQENIAASYLFAGEKALNSDRESLDKAKKMEFEGVDSEIIWKETGWFRGPDKKWRWEIDDSKGKYNNDFEVVNANDNKSSLEDHYENQELYDAYPDLRKTGYETADIGRVDGMYNPKADNLIVSDKYKKNKDDKGAEETIIHEIQHIIQNKEGFSKGGNSELALKLIRRSARLHLAETGDEKFIALMADGTINQMEQYIDKVLMKMYNVDNIEDVGFKVYESLQGEVEARIASKRMNMSSDERREKMPSFGNSLLLEELEDDKTFNKALSTQNKSPDNVSDIDNETKSRYKENEKRTSRNMVAGSEEAAFSMQKKEDEKKFSLSKKALGDLARSIKREYGSKYAIKDIKSALNELYDMDKNDDNLIDNKIQEIAKNVAQNVSSDLEYSERIKSFRDAVKDMPIKLDDSIKNDIPDFSSWAKKYFNRINFSKAGRAIDEYYQELAGAFPDFLDGDIINPADQIRSIADALDSGRSFKGDVDDIAYDVALSIYDDYYKHRAEEFNDGLNAANSDYRESFFGKGENPVRDIDIESENEHGKNMRFTRTAAESDSLNDEQADSLRKQVESGRFTYNVINDADAVSKANDRLERSSVDRELSYLEGLLESKNLLSKDDIVLGERIIQEYAKAGDVDNLERAIAVVATAGTRAGQAVQAMRVLKKLSPEGQLMALQKQINIINTDMNLSGDKKVKLSPERVKDIKSSSSSKGLEQALERAKMELYDKVPSRWIDKWNAWRYLSMLGNPKTHIRNIIGNAIFVPVRELKNVIGASIENAVVKGEKSKAIGIVPKVFKEFAAKEFDENRRIIEAGGKENMERERRIFKSSILEGARKLNSWALESEDQFFLRSAYVRSFAGYLKANKVSPKLVKKLMSGKGTAIEIGDASISKILDNAREYAMNEAQKATYRDYSAMANALNALKKKNAVTNVIGEGLMPFTKTPANILKRGVEYSPIGILKGIKELTHDVKMADEESRQRVILKGIDSMASGLSGSGILMLGMFLASQGILSGSGEEDKKLRDFDNMQGSQNYSINLGDFSYTIDWLAPVSLPLFVGVELFDSLKDGSWGGFTNIIDSMTAISEPMINMSMLQGINRAVTNYEPDKALTNLITDASVGYLSQGVPTVMGQIARTIDDSRRSTYVDKNKDIPVFIQKALQQVMAKTPGVSKKLNPYRDFFGRVQGKDSVISRALENFVSPGYVKKKERDEVLDELERVYNSTDDKRVIPSAPSKSFGDMNLSASEYDKVSEIKGNTAYDVISSMMNNSAYSNLDDTEKAKAISYAYDYAVAKAKDESLGIEPDGWIAKAYNAAREGIEPDVYIAYNAYKNSFDDSVNDSEKNRKTREVLFEDDSLSSSEKAVIDEYMFNDIIRIPKKLDVRYDNRELFEVTQEREADSKFYYKYEKYASKIGMDLKMYNNMYDIVYGNKSKGLKKNQKIRMMIDSGATERQANELYRIFYSSKYK